MQLKSFLLKSFFIYLSFAIASCKSTDSANQDFEEKFAKEIALINAKRMQDSKSPENNANNSKLKKRPQEFLPNVQTLGVGRAAGAQNQLPKDMFIIRYATNPHPPFTSTGIEFDAIEVPRYDAFGIASNLADKQYLLTGNNALQKNIDKIEARRTSENIEFSQILIAERKRLRQEQKDKQDFGDDIINNKKVEISDEEKKEKEFLEQKKAKRANPIQQAIGAQVIQQNLGNNMPPKDGKR
jgi:hypothetical protein